MFSDVRSTATAAIRQEVLLVIPELQTHKFEPTTGWTKAVLQVHTGDAVLNVKALKNMFGSDKTELELKNEAFKRICHKRHGDTPSFSDAAFLSMTLQLYWQGKTLKHTEGSGRDVWDTYTDLMEQYKAKKLAEERQKNAME